MTTTTATPSSKLFWLARVRELTHLAIDDAALAVAQATAIEFFDVGPADEALIRSLTIDEVARYAAATPVCPLCRGILTVMRRPAAKVDSTCVNRGGGRARSGIPSR